MISVLSSLGNPNKDFRDSKSSTIFLNYLELGFDLAFSDGGEKLEKIILRTNHFGDSFFGFYDRCYFEINGGQDQVSSLSKFSVTKPLIDKMMDSVGGTYYVKNPSSGARKSHIYKYSRLVVEVLPECDLIASLTIF
jgi:Uncharacterised protein family (UPF0183)